MAQGEVIHNVSISLYSLYYFIFPYQVFSGSQILPSPAAEGLNFGGWWTTSRGLILQVWKHMELQSPSGGRGLWGPGPASSPEPGLGALCPITRADKCVHDLLRPPLLWGPPPHRKNGKIFLLALAPLFFGSFLVHVGHVDD